MTIELDDCNVKSFEDCDAGKCFSDAKGRLFMKLDKKSGYLCDILLASAVDLSTGEVYIFNPKEVITIHENAKVIFK